MQVGTVFYMSPEQVKGQRVVYAYPDDAKGAATVRLKTTASAK